MRQVIRRLGCVAGVLAFYSASAVTSDSPNPYQGIVDRNVFGLKDPPPPQHDPESTKPAGPLLTLTGLMNILGKDTAFISFKPPAQPGKPPEQKESSVMLTTGQRDGEIEVLEIDLKGGSVKVSSFGSITNLTFKDNGVKGAGGGSPAPAGAPAIPPPQQASFTPGGTGFPAVKGIPPRMVRSGQPGQPGPGSSPAAVFTPGSPVQSTVVAGSSAAPLPGQPQQQYDNLTPEQREILLEASYQKDLSKGDPNAALYPPSYLDPNRNVAPTPGATGARAPQQPVPGQPQAQPRTYPRPQGY